MPLQNRELACYPPAKRNMDRLMKRILLALLFLPSLALAEQEVGGGATEGRPTPLTFEAGALQVQLGGRAQVQATFLAGDDSLLSAGDLAEDAGFRLRRARLGANALIHRARFGVEVDLLESNGSALHEAYVGYDSQYALLMTGLVKVPFSRSALLSSESLQLADRALGVDGIAPFQQLGAVLGGKVWDDRVRLLVGVFNGMHRSGTFANGWDRIGPSVGNRFGGYALATRLDFEPLGLLGSGVADLAQSSSFRFGVGGGFLLNQGESIETMGFAGDLALKAYGVGLLAEFIQTTTKPTDQPTQTGGLSAETTSRALVAQLGYTALANTLEVAARFELVDENTDVEDEGDFYAIGAAVSGYLLEGHVKLQLQYLLRLENAGVELDNDSLLLQMEGRF